MLAETEGKIVNGMNLLEVIGLTVVLLVAYAYQFFLHEFPCPLCLLQRAAMLGIAFGVICNLRFGLKPSHLACSLLSAILLAVVATRQILLHIVPGTGSYGSAFLGLHMYTWGLVIAIAFIAFSALGLFFDKQYRKMHLHLPRIEVRLGVIFMLLVIVLAVANTVTTYMECGLASCPENPTAYKEL